MQAITGSSQSVETTYRTDAWGNVQAGAATDNPAVYLGGLGYWEEPALGLDYVRARWLNTQTGSWLSVDPVSAEPRYRYAGNSPTFRVDPSGRQSPLDPFGEIEQQWNQLWNPQAQQQWWLDAGNQAGRRWQAFIRHGFNVANEYDQVVHMITSLPEPAWRALVEWEAEVPKQLFTVLGLPQPLSSELGIRALKRQFGLGNWIYLTPPLDSNLIAYEGGFIAGVVGTVVDFYATVPGFAIRIIFDILSGRALNDLAKAAKDQWGDLVSQFHDLPNMKPYDRGKLYGMILASTILLALSFKQAGQGLASLREKLLEIPAVKKGAAQLGAAVVLADQRPVDPKALFESKVKEAYKRAAKNARRQDTARVYRVQGGTPPTKLSQKRVIIGPRGELKVLPDVITGTQSKLYIIFSDIARARVYLSENRPGGYIISFEVDHAFVEQVRRSAKRQAEIRKYPDAPEISDPTRTSNLARLLMNLGVHESSGYGLPEPWITRLERAARRGSGRVELILREDGTQ